MVNEFRLGNFAAWLKLDVFYCLSGQRNQAHIRDIDTNLFALKFTCKAPGETRVAFSPEGREIYKDGSVFEMPSEWLDGFLTISDNQILLSITIE